MWFLGVGPTAPPGGAVDSSPGLFEALFICEQTSTQRVLVITMKVVVNDTITPRYVLFQALRLSSGARRGTTVGEIVNLMAVDAQRAQDTVSFLHTIYTAPILLIVATYFLWQELGPSTLAGFTVVILLLPTNSTISISLRKLQIFQMHKKDERIKLTNEILNGIKVRVIQFFHISFTQNVNLCKHAQTQFVGLVLVSNYICALVKITMEPPLLKNPF